MHREPCETQTEKSGVRFSNVGRQAAVAWNRTQETAIRFKRESCSGNAGNPQAAHWRKDLSAGLVDMSACPETEFCRRGNNDRMRRIRRAVPPGLSTLCGLFRRIADESTEPTARSSSLSCRQADAESSLAARSAAIAPAPAPAEHPA